MFRKDPRNAAAMTAPDEPKVSFGFRDVAENEKSRLVGRIFSNVARRYDVMNDLMSFSATSRNPKETLGSSEVI